MDNQDNKENSPCNRSCRTDMGRGCQFCEGADGVETKACEGCYKLHEFNWLEGIPDVLPSDIFEVRFKNTRKGYYRNVNDLPLQKGDIVAVESSPGHDVGIISLTGDLVARQMKRVGFTPQNGEFKKIYRKAKPYDIEKWQEAIALEHETMIRARQIAAEMNLNMKIGDVEYQGDKIKAIFYYIADERVDFRELIKVFADQFRIRIEMKQIGARQEAGRIGGLGSCGRELCCASWVSNFVSVTTNSARHQEISLNPQKLAGQCGKLKCCLVYELDAYMDARREFPRINQPLETIDGQYFLIKSDILNRTMWFSSAPTSQANMIPLSIERVREIIKANQRGEKVERLSDEEDEADDMEPTFANVVGEESLTRFDKQKRRNRKKKKGSGDSGERGERNTNGGVQPHNMEGGVSNGNRERGENGFQAASGSTDRPQRNRNDRPQRNNAPRSSQQSTEAAQQATSNNAPQRDDIRPRSEGDNRPDGSSGREGGNGRNGGRGRNNNRRRGGSNRGGEPRRGGQGTSSDERRSGQEGAERRTAPQGGSRGEAQSGTPKGTPSSPKQE